MPSVRAGARRCAPRTPGPCQPVRVSSTERIIRVPRGRLSGKAHQRGSTLRHGRRPWCGQPGHHRRARPRPLGRGGARARRGRGRSTATGRSRWSDGIREPPASSSPPRPWRAWPRPASTCAMPGCCRRRPSPTSSPSRAPTSARCSPPRTTRCPTTASSSSPAAGTSSPTTSRTASRAAWASSGSAPPGPTSVASRRLTDGADRYVAHLLSVLPHRLEGLHIVIDAAHGAASEVAPRAFREAGARGHPHRRRAGRHQHQRRLRLDAPRAAAGRRRRGGRRPRHRARR